MRYYDVTSIRDDNGTWLLTIPAFPEAASFGSNQTKGFVNVFRAFEVAVATRIADGARMDVPLTGAPTDNFVEVPPLMLAKMALYIGMRRNGYTRQQLAQKLDISSEQVDRLLLIGRNSHLDSLRDALAAIGITMEISFVGGIV